MKNYLWNMFSNIKNAQLSRKTIIFCKRKKICESFLKLLWDEGLIIGFKAEGNNELKIFLKYIGDKPAIDFIKVISKPSHRIYYSIKQIWKINSSKFILIFSTSKGLKSLLGCKKNNIGGELFVILN